MDSVKAKCIICGTEYTENQNHKISWITDNHPSAKIANDGLCDNEYWTHYVTDDNSHYKVRKKFNIPYESN